MCTAAGTSQHVVSSGHQWDKQGISPTPAETGASKQTPLLCLFASDVLSKANMLVPWRGLAVHPGPDWKTGEGLSSADPEYQPSCLCIDTLICSGGRWIWAPVSSVQAPPHPHFLLAVVRLPCRFMFPTNFEMQALALDPEVRIGGVIMYQSPMLNPVMFPYCLCHSCRHQRTTRHQSQLTWGAGLAKWITKNT